MNAYMFTDAFTQARGHMASNRGTFTQKRSMHTARSQIVLLAKFVDIDPHDHFLRYPLFLDENTFPRVTSLARLRCTTRNLYARLILVSSRNARAEADIGNLSI